MTMPRSQAINLPYYIYNMSNVKMGQYSLDDKTISSSKNESNDSGDDVTIGSRTANTTSTVHIAWRRKQKLIKWNTSSFPMHHNQLHPSMDLRSFTTMINMGQDVMALLHGRLAKRLWARLVAAGVTFDMLDVYNKHEQSENKKPIKHEDPASDMSHSSDSSESFGAADIYGGSDHRSQFNSQTTFGSTSVIGMDDGHADDIKDSETTQNQVIRLMSLVHTLPSSTHRNRVYIKIATELGTLRQLWENEFKSFFESDRLDDMNISQSEIRALKSFFGVDGSITPGPFWYSDPAMATDTTKLSIMMQQNRKNLIPRLRKFIKQAFEGRQAAPTRKEKLEESPNIKMEDVRIDFQAEPKTEERTAYMSELSTSLLDYVQLNNSPKTTDKYAKIVHEASIDTTNVLLSLSSFLNELSSSKAQMFNLQHLDKISPFDQGKLGSAKANAGMWNETIGEYLTLAENQTRPQVMHLYKRGGDTPQCASLAQAVMFRQSYSSNGGGIGCKRKNRKLTRSSARFSDIKEEEDEYESENDDEDQNDAIDLGQKELHTIQLSSADLIKRGKEYLVNEHLQVFTPIHLTTGVALLTEHMTPQSAEILSRPCSPCAPKGRTPFDLFKASLASLDDRSELISAPTDASSRWAAKGKVVDGVLVSSWESAAVVFRRCVKDEPQNIDNWSWYVATLLGIVCVSSGLSFSSKSDDSNSSVKSEGSVEENEVTRSQLDYYDEKRGHTITAIEDLIKVADEFDCPMFHLAISSMLEWRKAVKLIEDTPSCVDKVIHLSKAEVKRLHAFHVSLSDTFY